MAKAGISSTESANEEKQQSAANLKIEPAVPTAPVSALRFVSQLPVLDSFPVAVCDNIRISRCRLIQDERYRGKVSSKRRYFYGVRVQMVITSDGIPLEFRILPGSSSDLQDLAELALDFPALAKLFVDAGYNFYEWEDYLREAENPKFQVPRKTNSRRARERWLEIHKSLIRKYIETTIGEIQKWTC